MTGAPCLATAVFAGSVGAACWAGAVGVISARAFGSRRWGPDASRGWTPADLALEHEPLHVRTKDGLNLLGWFLPGTAGAAVLISGGYRGRAGDVLGIAAALQRRGLSVGVYGWRGTPGSAPAPHTLGVLELRDAEAALDALHARVGDVPIGLLGYSMGGALSIVVAARDPRIRAVCCDSAFADARGLLEEKAGAVLHLPGVAVVAPVATLLRLRTGARLGSLRPIDEVARIAPRPLLLIHGDADSAVPVEHARRLAAAAGVTAQLWTLPGAPHAGAYFVDRTAYVDRVAAFLLGGLAA